MPTTRRQAIAAVAGLAMAQAGQGQARYPNGPIKLVVPLPPGGQTDVLARLMAQKAEAALGQPIVVENVAGANTMIASERVAKSLPDGYTILFNITNLVQNAVLLPKVPYDPFRDFAPICNCYGLTGIFVVPTDGPRTLAAFIQQAKSASAINFGTPGHGSSLHFYGETLGRAAGITMNHVPYKGEAPLIPDLIAGRLDAAFISGFTMVQYARQGKLRALATSGLRRLKGLPDLPTFQELGVPGIAAESFAGFFAPAGTPPAIVQRLNEVFLAAAAAPDVKDRMLESGLDPVGPNTPKQFAALMRQVHDEWTEIRKRSAIRLE